MPSNNNPKTSKILLGIIVFLVVVVLGWMVYFLWKLETNPSISTSPTPLLTPQKSGSPTVSPSLKTSSSPSVSASPSAGNIDYKVPTGETYLMSAQADTNGDSKLETLVITSAANNKYHAYVLSSDGNILYDNKDLGQKPLRIADTTYSETDTYSSWMLVFTEQSGNLAVIHWNGTAYEIPQSMGI